MPSYIAVHQDGQARTDSLSLFCNYTILLSDTVKGNNHNDIFLVITYCHMTRMVNDEMASMNTQ